MANTTTQCDLLLVEDNPDHAELLLSCLQERRNNIKAVHVADGEQALNYLKREGDFADPIVSPRPSVVVLDLRMPKVDGLEVLRLVKQDQQLRGIPVVVLSTSKAQTDLRQAYHRHANSYLIKPDDYEGLRELIRTFDQYWLDYNCSPEPAGDDDFGSS